MKISALKIKRNEYQEFVRDMIIRPGNKTDEDEENVSIDHVIKSLCENQKKNSPLN